MIRKRIIPTLLLDEGKLIKTTSFKKPIYIGEPINAVKIFNEKEVDEILVLDRSRSIQGKGPDLSLIQQMSGECFMPLSYGGGIRTIQDARAVLKTGVEKIILSSHAISNPALIKNCADEFGSQSVSVCIDYKKSLFGKTLLASQQGHQKHSQSPIDWACMISEYGAGEIILQNIDRDGTQAGIDLTLFSEIKNRIKLPLVVCGGTKDAKDIQRAFDRGVTAIAAGAMFVFYGSHKAVLIQFLSREEQLLIHGEV